MFLRSPEPFPVGFLPGEVPGEDVKQECYGEFRIGIVPVRSVKEVFLGEFLRREGMEFPADSSVALLRD